MMGFDKRSKMEPREVSIKDLLGERAGLRSQLAAAQQKRDEAVARAGRLEGAARKALPIIANAIVHGMPVTPAVADARNSLSAALAEPADDAKPATDTCCPQCRSDNWLESMPPICKCCGYKEPAADAGKCVRCGLHPEYECHCTDEMVADAGGGGE